jgi:hypothetical protein
MQNLDDPWKQNNEAEQLLYGAGLISLPKCSDFLTAGHVHCIVI